MLSRRDVIGKLAAGTAVAWATITARVSLASTRREGGGSTGGAQRVDAEPGEARDVTALNDAPSVPAPLPQADAALPATLSAPPPWELLTPLTMGSVVTPGWRLSGLTGAVDGSCVLTLQNEQGRSHRLHICRNDGRPSGLVYTRRLDLVVMNGGAADLPTEERFAQAVAEVAHVLAANEDKGPNRPVVTALLPHAERVRLFADAAKLR